MRIARLPALAGTLILSVVALIALAAPASAAPIVTQVEDIFPGASSGNPEETATLGGKLYFAARDGTSAPASGIELWESDGTPAGTQIVKDINPGASGSSPTDLVVMGGKLYFAATGGGPAGGRELWTSDGTSAGTQRVADINLGSGASSPANLTVVGSTLFFTANDGTTGVELWASDGTIGNATLVKDINPAGNGIAATTANFTAGGSLLFFRANDGTNGLELWSSDGTTGGTQLHDINPGAASSTPEEFAYLGTGDTVLFAANNGTNGNELWSSDGTGAGTSLLKDINSGGATSSSNPADLTLHSGFVYFAATGDTGGRELWRSDGTGPNTLLEANINPGNASSSPQSMLSLGGTLFFSATNGTTGQELFRYDNPGGASLVKDIRAGSTASTPQDLTEVAGDLYFTALDDATGREVWTSDGTTGGTVQVADIFPGATTSNPAWLTEAGGALYFAANDGTTGNELWTAFEDTDEPQTSIDVTPPDPDNDTSPTFEFSGDDTPNPSLPLSFECQLDGGGWNACTSPHTEPGPLSDGSHTFEVRATDNAGNTDSSPASYTWTIDTSAPQTTIDSQPNDPTNNTSANFTFSGDDTPNPSLPLTFECQLDGGGWNACTSPHTYPGPLSDGSHTFEVRATDNAGNTDSSPASYTWTIDTSAPQTTIDSQPNDPTNNTSANFTFSGDDTPNPSLPLSFECQLDGGGWNACTSPHTEPGPLSDGSHTFEVRATDNAGNTDSSPASYTWTIDTDEPQTSIDVTPPDPDNDTSPTFEFSGDDTPNPSLPLTFECQLDGGGFSSCTSPHTEPGPLSDGSHTFEVRATDNAGNTDSSPASYTWTIDTQLPNTIIDTTPDNPTNDPNTTFTFHGTDPAPPSLPLTFECRRDGGPWNPCSSPENYTATEGQRTFEVRATDNAGNVDPTPASFTWVVDLTDPDITITSPTNREHIFLHGGPPSFSCSDPPAGAPPAASGIDTCDGSSFNNEDLGPHLFTVTATDNAGNTSTKTVVYVIVPPKYGDFILDDDPLAYYRHNEAPGSSEMLDSSGNDHDGEYKNNVALGRTGAPTCTRRPHPPRACEDSADPENKAAFFPERDGYGFVNGISAPTSGYTMEAWVKPRTDGAMMIMGHGGGGQLYRQANNRLALRQTQDTVTDTNAGGFQLIPTGAWTHVAATWDKATGTTRLFVNGILVQTSTSANKPPSGTSTFYVGYGESAPWFHGEIDESAYYDHALDQHAFEDRFKVGTAKDEPSLPGHAGASPFNTGQPFTDPVAPKNGGLYAPGKTPKADFTCSDPDDTAPFPAAGSDIASCTATVTDGGPPAPIANGAPLPDSLGVHTFTVTATDKGTPPNVYVHSHTYEVRSFAGIYGNAADGPVAYYRLGDPANATTMADSGPDDHDGEYKNAQQSSPTGISGDGNTARDFFGSGGYGYANGIHAPNFQMTLEAWVHPDNLNRDQSIAGHGDGGELFIENGRYKFRHGPQNRIVSSTPPYAPNPNSTYTQVVGTWDGVDLRIYVNGVLEGTLESNRGPTSSSTFYVGFGEIKPWFDGRIDEVAYYSTALNANRVFQHFLADPAADGEPGGGGTGGGGGGGGDGSGGGGGDAGGGDPDPGAGDTGGGSDEGGALEDDGEDSEEATEEEPTQLDKCIERAKKIANKKKRKKAIKRCYSRHGALSG